MNIKKQSIKEIANVNARPSPMSRLSMPASGLLIQLFNVINSQNRQFLAHVKPLHNCCLISWTYPNTFHTPKHSSWTSGSIYYRHAGWPIVQKHLTEFNLYNRLKRLLHL